MTTPEAEVEVLTPELVNPETQEIVEQFYTFTPDLLTMNFNTLIAVLQIMGLVINEATYGSMRDDIKAQFSVGPVRKRKVPVV